MRLTLFLVMTAAFVGATAAACSDDASPSAAAPTPDAAAPNDSGATPPPDSGVYNAPGPDAAAQRPLGVVDKVGRVGTASWIVPPEQRNGFNNGTLSADALAPTLHAGLVYLDLADGVDSWNGGPADGGSVLVPIDGGPDAGDAGTTTAHVYGHPLLPVVTADRLYLDISKPFSETSYLDVEYSAFVLGAPGSHTTCGGRWPNEDAVDKGLSFYVKRALSGVSDGVSAPTKPATQTFPYLAAPN